VGLEEVLLGGVGAFQIPSRHAEGIQNFGAQPPIRAGIREVQSLEEDAGGEGWVAAAKQNLSLDGKETSAVLAAGRERGNAFAEAGCGGIVIVEVAEKRSDVQRDNPEHFAVAGLPRQIAGGKEFAECIPELKRRAMTAGGGIPEANCAAMVPAGESLDSTLPKQSR
jgi:hypothetical protein